MKSTKFMLTFGAWLLFSVVLCAVGRIVLPWLAPFIIAFALASAMEGAVRAGVRVLRAPRKLLSAIAALVVPTLLCGAITLAAVRGGALIASLTDSLPGYLEAVIAFLSDIEAGVMRYISSAPTVVQEYLLSALDSAEQQLMRVPEWLSSHIPALITAMAEKTPAALLFAVTAGLGTYFMSASYPELMQFALRQLPEKNREQAKRIRTELTGIVVPWLRAQAILMGATFAALCLCLAVLRVKNALFLSALIALVDALPVLGVGTVLLPWAAVCLVLGEFRRAAGLAVGYGAITLLRSCLQAKVVGSQLGLHPLVSLFAIYVGFRACGVAGMILFPIAAVALCRLNSGGIVRIWK